MIKRILSICMLWLGCLTIWGQSTGGYGGDYNPTRPDDPAMPAARYSLTITATEGGTVSPNIENKKYTEGVGMWVRAYNQTGYKFVHWLQGDEKISTKPEFYYYTEAEDVVLTAVFEYNPGQYGGDYNPTLPDDPSVSAKYYNLTVECSPASASTVRTYSSKPKTGSNVYVETTLNSNYKFTGWWEEDELVSTEPHYSFTMEGRDMHLVAKFEYEPTMPGDPSSSGAVTTRTLKYRIDGHDYRSMSLVPGEKIKALDTPVKRGYTFKGWDEIPEVMPDYDVTVTGTFDINSYKVKFTIDGKSITKFLKYGDEIVPPDVWPAEGEVFRWIDMPATMPNRDIVVNGEYTAVKYALIYILDGEEYRRKEYKKGEEIIPLPDPEKEGFIFSGWSDIPTTMPATYVVVHGSFIDPNEQRFQVTFKVDGEVHHVDSVTVGSNLDHLKMPTKEGHTYNITNEIPTFMPKYDITIEGTFTINSYRLVYMIDGEVYKDSVLVYGTPITPETPPTVVGSAFTGWSEIPSTMPDRDITITGSFILNGYTITYIVDGEVYEKNIFAYGKDVRPLANLSKEGYTFSGWTEIPETMPNNDVTVYGSFTINEYKVTYMVNGSVYHTDTLAYNTPLIALEEPVKEGYTFSGWSKIPETVPASDIIISGVFTINKYGIIYTVDGSVYYSDSIEYGEKVIPIDNPSKEGYTFSGWSETPRTMPANNLVVSGKFSINQYKVIYIVDGNTHHTDTLEYGVPITIMNNPVKEGYTFSGWSDIPKTMPANDVTVNGTFTINKYKITYIVEGIQHNTDSLEYGTDIVELEWPVKEGYTFSGWGDIPKTMPARNVIAEGTFKINKYKITYLVEGETVHTDSITYNENIVPLDYPEKEGFTFSGWIGLPTVMPASDVTTGGEFFIKSTQTDDQGLMYALDEETQSFEVSNYTETLAENIVIPDNIYGYPVSGIRTRALMGAEALTTLVVPQSITHVGDKAFYGCHNVLYIEWKTNVSLEASYFDDVYRHGNMLVYVDNKSAKVTYEGNVVVDGKAEHIALTEGLPFRNIREFTARNISYSHEFTKKTWIDAASGWEAMILPFDVQTITSEKRGLLLPFGQADYINSLPYWTATMQADGSFVIVESLKAHTPFIIEIPNGDEYEDRYNVDGIVNFSASDATVYATTDMPQPSGQERAMMGTYEAVAATNSLYVINDEDYIDPDGATHFAGGVFVAGDHEVRPFEAYIYSPYNAAPYLRISDKGTTGMEKSNILQAESIIVYDLTGRKMSVAHVRELPQGIYIVNGKKTVIK